MIEARTQELKKRSLKRTVLPFVVTGLLALGQNASEVSAHPPLPTSETPIVWSYPEIPLEFHQNLGSGLLLPESLKAKESSLYAEPRRVEGPQYWVINYCTPAGETASPQDSYERQIIEEKVIPYVTAVSGGRVGPIQVAYSRPRQIPAISTFGIRNPDGSFSNEGLRKMAQACDDATDQDIVYSDGRPTIIFDLIDGDISAHGGADYLKRDRMKNSAVAGRILLSKTGWPRNFSVWIHENMHSFPNYVPHTRAKVGLDAQGRPIYDEHADPWSVNGGWLTNHVDPKYGNIPPRLPGPFLYDLGWSGDSDHIIVKPGRFLETRIDYLDKGEGEKPRIIVVEFTPQGAETTETYNISLRRRILDIPVPDPVPKTGAVLYKSDSKNFPLTPYELVFPEGATSFDPWGETSEFLDSENKIRIRFDRIDDQGLNLRVWNDVPYVNPSATPIPTRTVTPRPSPTPTEERGLVKSENTIYLPVGYSREIIR